VVELVSPCLLSEQIVDIHERTRIDDCDASINGSFIEPNVSRNPDCVGGVLTKYSPSQRHHGIVLIRA
jgi:hypothetical protein